MGAVSIVGKGVLSVGVGVAFDPGVPDVSVEPLTSLVSWLVASPLPLPVGVTPMSGLVVMVSVELVSETSPPFGVEELLALVVS